MLTLADKVAHAHREDGADVSGLEQSAIADITEALGAWVSVSLACAKLRSYSQARSGPI
ncbi:MAG TPA: hypothetical protein VLC49_13270 [Solirubrobacteraceae bacterium]|nr:hypothetical protein [Solirubrobacteraceae bacterium]